MFFFKLFLIFLPFLLQATEPPRQKIVSLICQPQNTDQELERLNQAMANRHFDGLVKKSTFLMFGKDFKKNQGIFYELLRKVSLDFPRTIAVDDQISKIVIMNTPDHLCRDFNVEKLPKEKLVLFMWEPLIRLKDMYKKKLHECFSRIYTWDDDLVDNKKYFKFNYPRLRPMIENIPSFEEKKLCTLVCAYASEFFEGNSAERCQRKFPNELYTQRIKEVTNFEEAKEEGFDFYGKGWDAAKFQSYRGPVADKIDAIKNYRFSICYENCCDVKGYITEKIFDCFSAGNVPIYWGASNIADYIPKDCFVDRRDFATFEELHSFLKNMKKEEYEGYTERIKNFLHSDQAKVFSQEYFDQIFFEAITFSETK